MIKVNAEQDQLEESKIIEYLQGNVDILMSYPGIFTGLSILLQTRGAIPLVERQIIMLCSEKSYWLIPTKVIVFILINSLYYLQDYNITQRSKAYFV